MSSSTERRGSVLMEFLMVLPIYFVLMGTVMMLGEMGIKSILLAVGDRSAAFSSGESWSALSLSMLKSSVFSENAAGMIEWTDDVAECGFQDAVSWRAKGGTAGQITHRADPDFKGSWSLSAAGRAVDAYALPPWTRGWLQYSHAYFTRSTDGQGVKDGALADLIEGRAVGRTMMFARPLDQAKWTGKEFARVTEPRQYGYYVLKRSPIARGDGYRNWKPKDITSGARPVSGTCWYKGVYAEKYATSDGSKIDEPTQTSDSLPEKPSRSDYERSYLSCVWSQ